MLLNGAPAELHEVIDALLESYVKEESHRVKLNAQEENNLISAECVSLYKGKREKLENAAALAHRATQLTVMFEQQD